MVVYFLQKICFLDLTGASLYEFRDKLQQLNATNAQPQPAQLPFAFPIPMPAATSNMMNAMAAMLSRSGMMPMRKLTLYSSIILNFFKICIFMIESADFSIELALYRSKISLYFDPKIVFPKIVSRDLSKRIDFSLINFSFEIIATSNFFFFHLINNSF